MCGATDRVAVSDRRLIWSLPHACNYLPEWAGERMGWGRGPRLGRRGTKTETSCVSMRPPVGPASASVKWLNTHHPSPIRHSCCLCSTEIKTNMWCRQVFVILDSYSWICYNPKDFQLPHALHEWLVVLNPQFNLACFHKTAFRKDRFLALNLEQFFVESLCFIITSLRETPCFNTCNNSIYDTTLL